MQRLKNILFIAAGLPMWFVSFTLAEIIDLGDGLLMAHQGGLVPDPVDYELWYECSPTAAGMMMGYYDRNGYHNSTYENLLVGAMAEECTFGNSGALINQSIASDAHVAEYYVYGYDESSDDDAMGDELPGWHVPNSLADFMGSSQDAVGNTNGNTWFLYHGDGTRLNASDLAGSDYEDYDGMFGIGEYIDYCGYDVEDLYTQVTDNMVAGGFSFDDYKNEINDGRVVMVQVDGHSLFGYGYDENNILFHDTWDAGEHSMVWGGAYSGLNLWGVTCLTIDGGVSVPEPSILSMLLAGLGMLVPFYRKKYKW